MDYVTLSDLVGKRVRKILSGSELLFIFELNKYSQQLLGAMLTLEDAQVIKQVRDGEHFAYVYNNSEINFNYEKKDNEVFADYKETERKYFNGDVKGVVFETQTDDEWVYCYNTDKTANIVLNGFNRSAGYVSLYAYMVVLAYRDRKPVPKLILKNASYEQPEQEYVDMLILMNFGNELLKGKVEIQYSKKVVVQPEWEAFIMYHRQLGYMLKESTSAEKLKYTLKNFKVGDVVLYYLKDKTIKSKTIRKLINCYPAVITEIDKDGIQLTYYPIIETRLTHRKKLEQVEATCAIDGFKYTQDDFAKFPECPKRLDFVSTGIDILTYTEDTFILKLQKGVDTFPQYVLNKKNQEKLVEMNSIETIYAVFEDRGVKYNKERFLDAYFKKETPIYDIVRNSTK